MGSEGNNKKLVVGQPYFENAHDSQMKICVLNLLINLLICLIKLVSQQDIIDKNTSAAFAILVYIKPILIILFASLLKNRQMKLGGWI